MHGATDAIRVAQSTIAETSGDGEPVIRIRQDDGVPPSVDREFSRARWAIAQPGVVAVVGHESSGSSLAAAPVYHDAGLPFLVPAATTPLLGHLSGVFPLPPNDSAQGAFIANFAYHELGAQTVSLFFVNDQYGRGLREGVVRELEALGVEVLGESPILPTSNLEPMIEASLARRVPDAIIAAVRAPDIWTVVSRVHELAPGMPIVAGDGAYALNRIPESVGPGAHALYVSVFWHFQAADSLALNFIEEYRRASGRNPRPSDALVFDAIMLAATAIRQVGADPVAVQRYLEELGVTRPPYRGVTGEIQFSGDRPRSLMIVTPRNGEFMPLRHGH